MNADPMYPFGFGLSYSTFTYSEAKANAATIAKGDNASIEVTVTNTGSVKADEVVQMYISDLEASVRVPNFQLITTKRITLAPGESKTLDLKVKPQDFELVTEEGTRITESGAFKLYIGGSSPMKRSEELGASKMAELEITVN